MPPDRRRRREHSPSECFYKRLQVLLVAAGRLAFLLQSLEALLQLPALLLLLPVLVQQETDRVLPGRELFFWGLLGMGREKHKQAIRSREDGS